MPFTDNIVIVTGSTRGIGKDIAEAFAKKGAHVIITGRTAETVAAVVHQFTESGYSVEGEACDVSNLQNVQHTVNKILDKHKRVDILINNAGLTRDNLLLRMTEENWDTVINTNLRGTFNFTKTVVKAMLKAKSGKIINISSIIGITGNSGQSNYAASKAAIIGFTKSVAREFASRGINVNAIAPGYIDTEMTDQLSDDNKQKIRERIPMGRLGHPADVSQLCLFLASNDATYITGQTIIVDGGLAI